MREKYFDGHIHSLNSDGAFSVSEIIRMVSLQGTHSAIAITDHNMFSLRAPLKTGELSVLPGCEFDCSYIFREPKGISLFFRILPGEIPNLQFGVGLEDIEYSEASNIDA